MYIKYIKHDESKMRLKYFFPKIFLPKMSEKNVSDLFLFIFIM